MQNSFNAAAPFKFTYSVCVVEEESESVSSEMLSSEIPLDGLSSPELPLSSDELSAGAGGIAASVILTVFLLLFAVVSLRAFTVLSAV